MANNSYSGSSTQNVDDLLTVLLQVKKNIMKSLNVASIAQVKKIDNEHKIATVQLYPILEDESEKNIDVYWCSNLETDGTTIFATNDIVLVIFCDRNFKAAFKKLKNSQAPSTLDENIDLHTDRYGIIVGKLN